MKVRRCARPGCAGTVRTTAAASVRFCSAKCASGWRRANGIGHAVHGRVATGKADQAPADSWWLNPETFYTEARTRFPLTGAAVVSRGKVRTDGPEEPGFSARAAVARKRTA